MTICAMEKERTPRRPDSDGDPAPRRKRTRDPEGHRAAILEAARAAFAERGFARATIRDVAERAGVTHGLVIRHFSTKEQLFLAAVPGTRDLAEQVAGDLDGLPERIARSWVKRMETAATADPLVALVRSAASNEESAKRLLTSMREQSVPAYRTVMPGSDTEQRVDLLGALLIGITFSRYVLKSGPLAEMPSGELIPYLAASLRGILLAPLELDETEPSEPLAAQTRAAETS
jgi:AcrR family transcriptional regulator